jgi:antitoxin (DNA-binding transcriptional repressor) of toxin-antitoxin stability system
MATIHIPESEAARDFAAVMAYVRAGSEVVIEDDALAVAVVSPPAGRLGILLSEVIARAEARGSTVTLDGDFGRDLEDAIASHRDDALSPPAWD